MRRSRPTIQVIRLSGSDGWSYERRGPNVPLLGIFLVALGAILLVDQLAPGSVAVGVSTLGVAAGLALLASWWRGGWGLYPGILCVAFSLPALLEDLRVVPVRDGYGSLVLGAALLVVSAFRIRDGRRPGWQGFLGLTLAIFGGLSAAGYANAGTVIWAAMFIAVGVAVLLRR